MCLAAAAWTAVALGAAGMGMQAAEAHKQRKIMKKANEQARNAAANGMAAAEAERRAAQANEAKEQQALDAGDMSDMSIAKRRHGVSSTFLNDQLGE